MTEIWKGAAKRLEDHDLPRIGHEIGVGEDPLHAFLDVEAAGVGFDSQGRLKMLFEPHVFWRELGPGPERDRAARLGLAYPKWRPGQYPRDSYPVLINAMAINRTKALRSASWGLGQIMGFNHLAAGYATVEDMIKDFAADEDNHVEAMVRFIKAKKIDDDLRALRWDEIERVYNGGGHGGAYARKMKERYEFWKSKPDTPWKPSEKYQGEDADEPIIVSRPVPIDLPDEHKPPKPFINEKQSIAAIIISAVLAVAAVVGAWFAGGN